MRFCPTRLRPTRLRLTRLRLTSAFRRRDPVSFVGPTSTLR